MDPPAGSSALVNVITLVVGALLAIGTVAVMGSLLVFGTIGYRLLSAAQIATSARTHLHSQLEDRTLLDHIEASDVDRGSVEALYLDWLEADREPQRVRAALAFLDAVDRIDAAGQLPEAAQHPLRRLHTARHRYEEDLALWQLRAAGLGGRAVIFIGAGQAPPRSVRRP